MGPEVKPNQGQGKNPQILSEETVVYKAIRPDTAALSGNRLLANLRDRGVEVLSSNVNVYNLPPLKIPRVLRDFGIGVFIDAEKILRGLSDADIPEERRFGSGELIGETFVRNMILGSNLIIDANLRFNNQPVRMHTSYELSDSDSHRMSLVVPFSMSANREVSLESLLPNCTTAGLSYDFVRNPEHRDRLVSVAQKRIPVEVFSEDFPKSNVIGQVTPAGIDTQINLKLQSLNPKNHLKCYEVEISEGDNKNVPQTTDVAPEAIWQPEENHYCMTGGESYPLIPVKLNEISRLKMVIDGRDSSPKIMADLLDDLPLSINGTNQWCVTMENPEGSLKLFFKPEWGENNLALVFNRISSKRISPKRIHSDLIQIDAVRKRLTERLAA